MTDDATNAGESTVMDLFLVSAGGAFGAVSRHVVGLALDDTSFPWATLVVNAVGSFVLGVVLFGVTDTELLLLVSVGFCGAFTTFSSFSFQTVALWERGDRTRALANALGNLVASLFAFAVAWLLVA
ncbi:fluoride efflux transporter CrcB [Halovenus marina]|uniref:fluoride efflux transporter CrcB n=1 Tax=Halovenus marina TaxID=3396621 RepID=UPI003F55E0D8